MSDSESSAASKLLAALVLLAAAGGATLIVLLEPPASGPGADVAAPIVTPVKEAEQRRRQREAAWRKVEPRVAEADASTHALAVTFARRVDEFFEQSKQGAQPFADAVLGLRSKWELIKSREGHRRFIAEQFQKHVMSAEGLEQAIGQAMTEYLRDLEGVENQMLVRIRADLADSSEVHLPQFSEAGEVTRRYEALLEVVQRDVMRDLRVDVGREITSMVTGEMMVLLIRQIVTSAMTKLGVSAAILGSGAASSVGTFGAGLVIGFAVDEIVQWGLSFFYDPSATIAEKVRTTMETVRSQLVDGDAEARRIYQLVQVGRGDTDPAVRQAAEEAARQIERGGQLGLIFALNRFAAARCEARRRTLQQMVLSDGGGR